MGIFEDLLKDNKTVIEALLKLVEGKQAKAVLDLDGVGMNIGQTTIALEGKIKLTFTPVAQSEK